MPWHLAPMDLDYTPLSYPSHDYSGEGEIVTVRLGQEVVGYLTRKGEGVGWLPRGGLSEDADTLRVMVNDILREHAAAGEPLVNAWAACLDATPHDEPKVARLDGLRGD